MISRLSLILLLTTFLLAGGTAAADIYVPDDYPTIQGSIDAASPGDTIIVRPGTYVENISFKGKAITVTSEAGAKDTVIDGHKPADPDVGSVVVFRSGEGPGSVLQGFKLRKGKGTKYGPSLDFYGGGVFCLDASPVIRDCVVNDNDHGGIACFGASAPKFLDNKIAYNEGRGVYMAGPAAPEIRGNTIHSNQAGGIYGKDCTPGPIEENEVSANYKGGLWFANSDVSGIRFNEVLGNMDTGIYCEDCTGVLYGNHVAGNKKSGIRAHGKDGDLLIVSANTVEENSGEYIGGGIRCEGNVVVTGNVVRNNEAHEGAGIGCDKFGSLPCVLDHNIITDNHMPEGATSGGGGGITIAFCTNVRVEGNIIANNEGGAPGYGIGGGLYCRFESKAILTNNIFYGNQASTGGAIGLEVKTDMVLTNNSFWGNRATDGGALAIIVESSVTGANNIFWNDTARAGKELYIYGKSALALWNSDVQKGIDSLYFDNTCSVNWGPVMIDMDPAFADPRDGDFHLTWYSPCRLKGDPDAPEVPEVDFEGDPVSGKPSMGADHYHVHLYFTGEATVGGRGKLKFVGKPNYDQVILWLGSGLLDPPVHTSYGDWYLAFPLLWQAGLGSIPAPTGILSLPFRLDSPAVLYLQAGVGQVLTNPLVLDVK